jgi:hypothetical protein
LLDRPSVTDAGRRGLRTCHVDQVLDALPGVPWFELLADNHLAEGGLTAAHVEAVRTHYPLALHCVGMNLAGPDPLDFAYLRQVRGLRDRAEAAWVSDHLCFTAVDGRHYHELLPFPYSGEALRHVVARVLAVEDFLGEALVVENVSSYLRFADGPMTEAQRLLAGAIDGTAGAAQGRRLRSLVGTGAGSLSVARRLSVYRDSSRRARERALEVVYPVCRQLLGARCFATLAAGLVDAHPSNRADLNRYGAAFPRYLRLQMGRHAALTSVPYLADLARLEHQWHAAYYAPSDPGFDADRFAAVAGEDGAARVRFQLSASLRLLASDYPIAEIWRRHREGGDTAAVAASGGERLVISRVRFRPRVEAVDVGTFNLLMGMVEGRPLCDLAEAGRAIERIAGLITAGWIVGFTADGEG